jgi:Mycolic acid cyclopropane synthetase
MQTSSRHFSTTGRRRRLGRTTEASPAQRTRWQSWRSARHWPCLRPERSRRAWIGTRLRDRHARRCTAIYTRRCADSSSTYEGPAQSETLRALRRTNWHGFRRPPVPQEQAPPRWRRGLLAHTKARDAAAIAHHYDLSNRLYELLLGSSMAYSCAIFSLPDQALHEAQANKFDLVCRKLDLRPGQRLLDIGAGWGGMVMHCAANYGVLAVGVTLSRQQSPVGEPSDLPAGIDAARTGPLARLPRFGRRTV